MIAVPLTFASERSNPVPGEDQSIFGYPITLQVGIKRPYHGPRSVGGSATLATYIYDLNIDG
jgi:hypothetical protein